MGKYTKWYENQNAMTKAYFDKMAVWHDRDMVFSFVGGILLGMIVGIIL